MKIHTQRYFLLLISSVLLIGYLSSCQKIEWELYYNQAIINGEDWNWSSQQTYYELSRPNTDGRLTVSLVKSNEFKEPRETIIFSNVRLTIKDTIFLKFLQSGTVKDFPNIPSANFYTSGADGDLHISTFQIHEAEEFPSWLVVEEINNKVIQGQFQAMFVIDKPSTNNYLSDTLRITQGTFLARQID